MANNSLMLFSICYFDKENVLRIDLVGYSRFTTIAGGRQWFHSWCLHWCQVLT